MTTKKVDAEAFIDHGWAAFAIAHQLKICQFLTFKKVSASEFSVVIFNHTCIKVMTRCPDHGDATRCVIIEEEVRSCVGIVSLLS
jgi:hypothetical protein